MNPPSSIPALPAQHWLPRKVVIQAVGNWKRLRALERAGRLHRAYPAGLKRARYARPEVEAALLFDNNSPRPEIPTP